MLSRRGLIKFLGRIASAVVLSPARTFASDDLKKEIDIRDWLAKNKYSVSKNTFDDVFDFCSKNGVALFLPAGEYIIDDTVKLPSHLKVRGVKGATTIRYSGSIPREIFHAEGQSNIEFDGLSFDGGMTVGMKDRKFYVRGVRFVGCTDVTVRNCQVSHCADWHLSFESCSRVDVRSCSIAGGGDGRPGGRDGIHFLDSSNVFISDIDADSGDDCVAFTVESSVCENIKVENVRGTSKIGSVLIFNEEGSAVSSFRNLAIRGIFASADVRDIVRVQAINAGTRISEIAIQGVTGVSRNHAVFLAGIEGAMVSDINVTSEKQNGLHCVEINNLKLSNIKAKSKAAGFDGIHVQDSRDVICVDINGGLPSGEGIRFMDNSSVEIKCNGCSSKNGNINSSSGTVPQAWSNAKLIRNKGLVFAGK